MFKRIIIAAAASLALVVATGGAALADVEPPDDNPSLCGVVDEISHQEYDYQKVTATDWVLATPGEGWVKFGERTVTTKDAEDVQVAEAQHYSLKGNSGIGNDDTPLPPGDADYWTANTHQEPHGSDNITWIGTVGVGLHYASAGSSGNRDWFFFAPAKFEHHDAVTHQEFRFRLTETAEGVLQSPGAGWTQIDERKVITVEGNAGHPCDLPKDAGANVTITPATCDAPGVPGISGANARLVGSFDLTPGDYEATFKAVDGHLFANGTDTLVVPYTIPDRDLSLCPPTDAGANVVVAPATCDADGTILGISGTFASVDGGLDSLDSTPGEHEATFTALPGHWFANGTNTLTVKYTIEAATDDCPLPQDAGANVVVGDGTCSATGSALGISGTFATLDEASLDSTPGDHTVHFTALPGHLFADGTAHLAVSYTIGDKDLTKCPHLNVAQFNAGPGAPKCDAAGTFNPDLTGATFLVENDGVRYYSLAGDTVRLSVQRLGLGVNLYLFANDDATILEGLSSEWLVNRDGRSATRTVVLEDATGVTQSTDPEAGCYVAPEPEPIPTTPITIPATKVTPAGDEVLAADTPVPAGFYSEVLAAEDPASAELAQTGSNGVAITLGAALVLVFSGLGLTVFRRRATR